MSRCKTKMTRFRHPTQGKQQICHKICPKTTTKSLVKWSRGWPDVGVLLLEIALGLKIVLGLQALSSHTGKISIYGGSKVKPGQSQRDLARPGRRLSQIIFGREEHRWYLERNAKPAGRNTTFRNKKRGVSKWSFAHGQTKRLFT